MPDSLDYRTADLHRLLSDPQVQRLLDISEQHPDWSIMQMTEHFPKTPDAPPMTYDQAKTILRRLHLISPARRKLRLARIADWEQGDEEYKQQLAHDLIPNFFTYLKYRKDYKQTKLPPQITPVKMNIPEPRKQELPITTEAYTKQPVYNLSPVQENTIKTFNKFFTLVKQFSLITLVSFLFFFIGSLVFDILFHAQTLLQRVGMLFSFTALFCGLVFFLYSLKYYVTIAMILSFSRSHPQEQHRQSGIGGFLSRLFGVSLAIEEDTRQAAHKKAISLQYDLSAIQLERHPFVSIQVATYNEKRVIDRFLLAATAMEYDKYEVIVADDSTDETQELLTQWANHPRVKISHRPTREGYKGGALKQALALTDPRAEFILVFDADFIPYPDTISQFLKYFQAACGTLTPAVSPIAAVQGYQWHILNKSENWITRGVRTEYAGSYVIERSGEELYQGLKQISGSVYMIRADILKTVGWGTSITEDFELTLKLYAAGYKVLYTPYLQSPAEAVSTIKRLIRQRMRWAEGHSFNVKQMFTRLLCSPKLSGAEKLEFLYLAPYYLQAFFFIVGTLCWFIAEILFQVRLPFWTEVWGWSLVLTNMFALPLMNLIGLFMEQSNERDYLGLISFVLLSYIIAPFQAFAAVKGFLETEEGPWFRTPKTGRITDSFVPGRFSRFVRGIFGFPLPALAQTLRDPAGYAASLPLSPAFAFQTESGGIRRRHRGFAWRGKSVLASLLILVMLLNYLAFFPLGHKAEAAWYDSNYKYKKQITIDHTKVGLLSLDANSTANGGAVSQITWTHTTGTHDNRLLVVSVATYLFGGPPTVTSITYNGVNLSKISNAQVNAPGKVREELWYLLSPATGSNSVVVNLSGSGTGVNAGAQTFYNVDQTNPFGTAASATYTASSSSLSVSGTSTNQIVIEGLASSGTTETVTGGQTQVWNLTNNGFTGAFSYKNGAAGSTSFSWSSSSGDFVVEVGVPVNAAFKDFPVLISEASDNDLKNNVQNSSGYDIIFTDSTGSTKLDEEIEKYVSSTGEFEIWVRIPTLSAATDTVIYMYFDKTSVTVNPSTTGVWDTNYKGVWHLKETGGQHNDSTSNGNNSTSVSVTTQGTATGQIDGADTFTGSANSGAGNSVQINGLMGSPANVTISCWGNLTTAGTTGAKCLTIGDSVSIDVDNSGTNLEGAFYAGVGIGWEFTDYSHLYAGTGWHYFVFTVDSVNHLQVLYVDGLQKAQATDTHTISYTQGSNTFIGHHGNSSNNYNWTGSIDETRVSNMIRSAGWIATEYNNQSSPATFETFGSLIVGGNPTIEQSLFFDHHQYTGTGQYNTGIIYVDTSRYPGATYYFEVVAKVNAGSGSVDLVYGAGSGAEPSGGSTLTSPSINSTSYTYYRSNSFSMTTGNAYIKNWSCSTPCTTLTLIQARIIIVQTDATKITDTQTHIEIGAYDGYSAATTTDTRATTARYWKYDSSKYDGTVTVYFEATLQDSDTGKKMYASLYPAGSNSTCTSDGTQVAGSEVSTNGSDANFQRVRSSPITLSSGTTYMVCYRYDSGGAAGGNSANASIIIDQTAAGGLNAMELYHESVGFTSTTTANTYGSIDYSKFKYDPADWAGGTFTYYFESTLKTSAATAYTQLYNNTDSSAISGSEVTTTNTSDTLVRSGSLTMPSSAKDLITQNKNDGTNTTTTRTSWLIIDVSNLQVPENLFPFLPLIIFLPKLVEYVKKRRKLRLAVAQHTVVSSKIASFFARKNKVNAIRKCPPDTS